ncbi:hypothetical protein [Actinomycetospora cinnamomea]|uniref:hypothetical protein n=1 Tax=Actinomycetospora cinnamomea TaxID=663609 RepID=UPI000E31ECC7|nr:hypothetical protein [Actinomycetospora cinnamomea]
MTRIPGEPLGELMTKLDGTVFSHSGIAVRTDDREDLPATHLASALAKDIPDDGEIDIGGVRWDAFPTFWRHHRDLYCIPMSDPMRGRALGYLARFREQAGEEGAFSFTKLVTVAAALRSVELRARDPELAESIFTAAARVATALAPSARRPSYYCAELVANAYGRTFTRGEMIPPQGTGHGIGDAIDESWWFAWLLRLFDDEIDGIRVDEWRAATELMGILAARDQDFLVQAVTAVTRSVGVLGDDVVGGPSVPEPLVVPPVAPDLPGRDDPIPHGLVTPRMLWAAFGQGTLRKVAPVAQRT